MAKRETTGSGGASAWLVDGLKRRGKGGDANRTTPRSSASKRTSASRKPKPTQWLAVPGPKRASRAGDLPPDSPNGKPKTRRRSGGPRRAEPRRARNPRERLPASRLKRAQAKLEAQAELIAEMRRQLDESESGRRDSSGHRPDPDSPSPQSAAPRGGSGEGAGTLDLNRITFEQLRQLGLSVKQSARVVSYRDLRQGFESTGELGEIPGLSKADVDGLKGRLRVGPR